jgi:hypothetical protein
MWEWEVNLHIVEVIVLFAGHRTMEVQFRDCMGGNPRSKNWLGMERGSARSES